MSRAVFLFTLSLVAILGVLLTESITIAQEDNPYAPQEYVPGEEIPCRFTLRWIGPGNQMRYCVMGDCVNLCYSANGFCDCMSEIYEHNPECTPLINDWTTFVIMNEGAISCIIGEDTGPIDLENIT